MEKTLELAPPSLLRALLGAWEVPGGVLQKPLLRRSAMHPACPLRLPSQSVTVPNDTAALGRRVQQTHRAPKEALWTSWAFVQPEARSPWAPTPWACQRLPDLVGGAQAV